MPFWKKKTPSSADSPAQELDIIEAYHAQRKKKHSTLRVIILVPVIGFAIIFGVILLSIYLPPSSFDPAMEQVIREALEKPEGEPLNRTELKTLSFLDASNRGIEDLRGMQQLPQMRVLFLQNNPITSVAPLRTLPVLGLLDLRGCPVEDVEILTRVKYIYTDDNPTPIIAGSRKR